MIPFDDGSKTIIYWPIETEVDIDLTEYINENEILCSKHYFRNVIVYLTQSYEDYLLLNAVIRLTK